MHFTLYDLFANTLFGQTGGTGGRKEAGVGVGVWHSRRLGQLTQKACRLISLNIYEIKAQAAGVLKFDSLLWSPAACVYVCVCVHGYVRVSASYASLLILCCGLTPKVTNGYVFIRCKG